MTREPSRGELERARVLLTGLPRLVQRLEPGLARLGATVCARPTIAVEALPEVGPRVRAALAGAARSVCVVITSGSAVDALAAAGLGPGLERAGHALACVGRGTAETLRERLGLDAAFVGSGSGARSLVRLLDRQLDRAVRLVWLRAERTASDPVAALRDAGRAVDEIVLYRTVAARSAAQAADELRAARHDVVLFGSPSSLDRLLEAAGAERAATLAALADARVVVIGATTAAAAERAGIPASSVTVASDSSVDGLLRATIAAWGARGTIRGRPAPGAQERTVSAEASEVRRTPLHGEHERAGARLVDFAGWHMPVQYAGVIDEHLAVRRAAGLFDVSHMGEAHVRGAGALAFLQYVTCNDVSRLAPGRAHYTALTTPGGTFVDDLLIYMLDEADYLLVLNAANTPKDVAWLLEHAGGFDVAVEDVSADWAQIAIQGPHAAAIVDGLRADASGRIRYYRFSREPVAGVACILSRTGYTGEDGYELYCAPGDAAGLWVRLLEAGAPAGLAPVGLAARDTLRLEAKMALYGNDIDDTTSVLEADLGWICKLDKGEFIGRDALLAQQERGIERRLVGFELRDRGIARQGGIALHDGRQVGRVTSGSHAPFLGKSIGLAYLPVALGEVGTPFEIDVRGRRLAAEVVSTPFYTRARRAR